MTAMLSNRSLRFLISVDLPLPLGPLIVTTSGVRFDLSLSVSILASVSVVIVSVMSTLYSDTARQTQANSSLLVAKYNPAIPTVLTD